MPGLQAGLFTASSLWDSTKGCESKLLRSSSKRYASQVHVFDRLVWQVSRVLQRLVGGSLYCLPDLLAEQSFSSSLRDSTKEYVSRPLGSSS